MKPQVIVEENLDRVEAFKMKQRGIERSSGRCPICYDIIFVPRPQDDSESRYPHAAICTGSPRRKGS